MTGSTTSKPMYFKFLTLVAFHAFMELKVSVIGLGFNLNRDEEGSRLMLRY